RHGARHRGHHVRRPAPRGRPRRTRREDDGFLRLHLKKGSDRIVGATLVARHAGNMISELTLAMTAGIGRGAIAGTIHPYPTRAEVMKKAADAYNRTRLTPP